MLLGRLDKLEAYPTLNQQAASPTETPTCYDLRWSLVLPAAS